MKREESTCAVNTLTILENVRLLIGQIIHEDPGLSGEIVLNVTDILSIAG
jgi:hypothetical protein